MRQLAGGGRRPAEQQLRRSRDAGARAAARAEPPADIRESRRDDDDDAARLAFLLGFDDVLRSGGVTHTTPTASPCGPSALPAPTRGTDAPPSSVARLKRDVARYAAESLRAHARLLDAETLRRRVEFDERRRFHVRERSDDSDETEKSLVATTHASTIETLSILTAAAREAPPRVSAAARDAAAAAIRLGRAVAEFSDDAEDIEDTARELRAYVSAALDAHPAALAEVRACLATTFLAAPFRALPPLSEDAAASSRGAADDSRPGTAMNYADAASRAAAPSAALLDASGALRRAGATGAASATASPSWLAAVGAGMRLLHDADRGEPRRRRGR